LFFLKNQEEKEKMDKLIVMGSKLIIIGGGLIIIGDKLTIIGIIGLIIVALLWVLLYVYFIKRANRFMENWEKEFKAKIDNMMEPSLKALEDAAQGLNGIPVAMAQLKDAGEQLHDSAEKLKIAVDKKFGNENREDKNRGENGP
jgi:F0F1-type ATP synthase membrane subunit b/b'